MTPEERAAALVRLEPDPNDWCELFVGTQFIDRYRVSKDSGLEAMLEGMREEVADALRDAYARGRADALDCGLGPDAPGLTDAEAEALAAAERAATPGPWEARGEGEPNGGWVQDARGVVVCYTWPHTSPRSRQNAALVALARTLLPRLLAERRLHLGLLRDLMGDGRLDGFAAGYAAAMEEAGARLARILAGEETALAALRRLTEAAATPLSPRP